jgi:uncharacterized protein YggE
MENHWSLSKVILTALAMVLLAGIVVAAILRDRLVNQPQWQVSVIGQGKVAYQPDIANVTLGVQIDRVAKADEALNQLNDKINKIVVALKAAGINDNNIQTQNYSLFPQYDYPAGGTAQLSGYSANQQLIIKVDDIDKASSKVSKVISEATRLGANQVIGVTFDVTNLDDLKQEARVKAIDDAKNKAGRLANAANVRLGKVVGWWENFLQAPGLPYYGYYAEGKGGAVGGAAPVVPSGSQEIVVEVNLNYQVK